MKLAIHSRMAELANQAAEAEGDPRPYVMEKWIGEAPIQMPSKVRDSEQYRPDEVLAALSAIYRHFNRVDAADEGRLERMGYRLPSLSVNDEIETPFGRFTVAPIGFKEQR